MYTKKPLGGDWAVRRGETTLAIVREEGYADILIACLERDWTADEVRAVPACFDGDRDRGCRLEASFFDARGVQVVCVLGDARTVALDAAEFVLLHGGDHAEDGKSAQCGSIQFAPAERNNRDLAG
jgi:hypothetical protein